MSHDRKPGRVRVMQPGAPSPQRRRRDRPGAVVDAAAIARSRNGGQRWGGQRGGMMLAILFLLATVGGAVATVMYLPS